MSRIPSNLPVSERQGGWESAAVNQAPATFTPGASIVDILEEGQIGATNLLDNLTLEVPKNKPSDIRSTIDALGSLNEENITADTLSILRLLHRCSLEQRAGARMVRQSEMQANINAQYSAAHEIRESSFQRMMGGIAAGALQIGSAGLQAYSATKSLTSLGTLKEAPSANASPTADTLDAGAANSISKDIATQAEPGKALIEQPPVTFQDQGDANKMAIAERDLPKRSVAVDEQGTLTVRDAKGSETLKVEIIDEAADVAPVPTAEKATSPADTSSAASEAEVAKPTDREITLKELDFKAARLKAASDITHATGNILNAFAQNSASAHDAQKAEQEAIAKTHEMASHQAGDEVQQTLEQARVWREMLQGIDQNNIETNRSISRHI